MTGASFDRVKTNRTCRVFGELEGEQLNGKGIILHQCETLRIFVCINMKTFFFFAKRRECVRAGQDTAEISQLNKYIFENLISKVFVATTTSPSNHITGE